MHLFLLVAALLALVFGPGLWVRRIMDKYSLPEDRYSGTGAQLARHLLDARLLDTARLTASVTGGAP